jgi:pyrroline-5-carboxylate reductase
MPLVGPQTLLVSIMAGVSLAALDASLPGNGGQVRAMPNLAASLGCGITGALASPGLLAAKRDQAARLLAAAGAVEWVADEDQINAVTAISGSGPAYVFYLAECLARAGETLGLAPDAAARLARGTITSAAALLAEDPAMEPAALRQAVTSPGGTTAAALAVLMAADSGLDPLLAKAAIAARDRARELSGEPLSVQEL